jgi:uncharacterized protein
MNSPNNNIYTSLNNLKILCCLLYIGVWNVSFGQDEEVDPNGHNVFYFDNGSIASEGNFKNGLPIGVWKSYFQNGQLKSIGNKKDGKSDSLWKFYNEIGLLIWSYEYANDMKNGCAIQYDSLENVMIETFYVDDKKQGEEQWYSENGKLIKRMIFENDKAEGLATVYDENGNVIVEEEYKNGFLRKKKEFNKLDENGEKTGVWRTYFKSGNIATEISYRHGKKDGTSKEFDKDGKLIDINKMVGDSIASNPGGIVMVDLYKEYHSNGKLKLLGGLNKGKKSGVFREFDKEGNLIKAYIFIKDTLVSEGMIQSGGVFIGEWKTYYRSGEIKAKGPYVNGKKDGDWIFYYEDGEKEQSGRFKEDVLMGQWNWYYHNGQLKKEEFFNRKGLLEGIVIEYDSLGIELAKGEYFNGKKEGAWFYNVGDYKEVGSFVFGEPDGLWMYYYLNGKIAFKGEFLEGEPKGKHVFYFKNGLRKTVGKYAGGEKHGLWRTFDKSGEQTEVIQYKRGEIYKINGFRVREVDLEE